MHAADHSFPGRPDDPARSGLRRPLRAGRRHIGRHIRNHRHVRRRLGESVMTTYTVSSGHTSSGITLNSGDELVVLHGGVAVDTTVHSFGTENIYDTTTHTTLSGGGFEDVYSGG